MISIITINYNNRLGLKSTLDSVFSQKDIDYELIVIDGGSNDGSVDELMLNNDKIKFWVSEEDKGIYNAMNKGIRKASGDYLLFLNSADTLRSNNTLENVYPKLDGSDLVVGLTSYRSDTGKERITQLPVTGCDLNFLIKSSLPHQSTFIRKELLVQDGYDEELKICSDWKFFLEVVCMKKCSVKIINDIVTNFDMTGISTNPQNYSNIDSEKKKVLWETLKFDWDDWKRLESRVLTADYYEKLWNMKFYFFVNNILRSMGFIKK